MDKATTVEKVKDGAGQVVQKAEQAGQQTVDNPWVERLVRVGYVARGVLYVVVGVLAVQLAIGVGGATTDKNGAIATIAAQPFGHVLLILIAVGLLGYSLWGFIRAILDPLHRGTDPKGIAQRIGYLISALSYGSVFLVTVHFLTGQGNAGNGQGSGAQEWSAALLHQPLGPWLVGIIGLIGIAGGLGQMWQAATADFKKDWKLDQMSRRAQEVAIAVGRFGIAARGGVFFLLGYGILQAALHVDPNQAKGMDGALATLGQQPFGSLLLGVVALGLVSFGIYSMLCARWIRI